MPKPDANSRDNQTIYEIFRACRLCGAGGGYKMPIIQNEIGFGISIDLELRQKILDCVQIEVSQGDRMPPLICELCVDKVNDFYEFLDMCRQTNRRTRLRLGLPPQNKAQGPSDSGDCILGVSEPVFVPRSSNEENTVREKPKPKSKKLAFVGMKRDKADGRTESADATNKQRMKNELAALGKVEAVSGKRGGRDAGRPPPRAGDVAPTQPKDKKSDTTITTLKSILKNKDETSKRYKDEGNLLVPTRKRSRQPETKAEAPAKKLKITINLPSKSPPPRKSPAPATKPKTGLECLYCDKTFKAAPGLQSHLRGHHLVTYTAPELACDACGEWFATGEAAAAHHRRHHKRPYRCRRCGKTHRTHDKYHEHIANNKCVPWEVVPDVKCPECWGTFVTDTLRRQHRCMGHGGRPGGKCRKCNRKFLTQKNLSSHEANCTQVKNKGASRKAVRLGDSRPRVSLVRCDSRRRVRFALCDSRARELVARRHSEAWVRVARCDPLLRRRVSGHYDVSSVPHDYGLDRSCVYPYISSYKNIRIKPEPLHLDDMVSINEEIRNEFYREENYVHWDSDLSNDSDVDTFEETAKKKRVENLTVLSLKTLFSRRCIGKVPRKLRKIQTEKFDSFFNTTDNIIYNLGNDDNDTTVNYDSDSLIDQDTTVLRTVPDFDAFIKMGENEGNNKKDPVMDVTRNEKVINDNGYDTDASIENDYEKVGENAVESVKESGVTDDENIQDVNKEMVRNNSVDSTVVMENGFDKGRDVSTSEIETTNYATTDIIENVDFKHSEVNDDKIDITPKIVSCERTPNFDIHVSPNKDNNIKPQDDLKHAIDNIIGKSGESSECASSKMIENDYDKVSKNASGNVGENYFVDDIMATERLIREIDSHIGDSSVKERNDRIILNDLMPNEQASLSLENISDEEFNFDT